MDIRYQHSSEIYVLRACLNGDASDLIAIGGEHSVEVLYITPTGCQSLASFHVGTRITALAWSDKTLSPSSTSEWLIELAAAGADFGLYLLTKSSLVLDEHIFSFGGGLSGHHGKVSDMSFCGGRGPDSSRYVATVSDDKMLMVWDLHPTVDISSSLASPARSPDARNSASPPARPQPTAYVIAFPHPLTSICSHPTTSKEFLVSDSRGSIFLTDWRSDPEDVDATNWRHSSLVELVEPHALSTFVGLSGRSSARVGWRQDNRDIIGGIHGSRFSLWDISNLRGGRPSASGTSFPEGGDQFRWCQTYPDYFAVSTQSPDKGAVIHAHNVNYVHAQPTVFNLYPRPLFVRDFDFLAMRGIPRIAAAVGRSVVIFSIGVDS